ncbi:hypothetical protein D0Z07_7026 [Hyphodiscus hymeniophilus]|uniref:Amidohydrolase-related domain-containing protein n=1 Tax=Hyphodiscus hymeniophilus TaxID=353542 RepID=A0A9P6VG97_9HELO|nr:hypothetical protein D0Z07_7026 [Hyphodiscus hymeniophilus]
MPEITLHTSLLFDPKRKKFVEDISITVDPKTGLITKVFHREHPIVLSEQDVDLRGKVVMPGFWLTNPSEASAAKQKNEESMPERIIRAVNHCRRALLAGYTTYRDLGTESMQDTDTNVRDAIARGLIPGPRLFVATRAIASTGAIESTTENRMGGHCLPSDADAADGVEECRKAVRRRITAGADIIKFYADYRRRVMRSPPAQAHPYVPGVLHPPRDPNPDILVFSQEEMDMIVSEAKLAKCPVAAHAISLEGAMMAIKAGVSSVEHACGVSDEMFQEMLKTGCIMVPTLAILEKLRKQELPRILTQVKHAHEAGVRIACGGDTGTFNHGENAREMELLIDAGLAIEDVLESCTIGGWKTCGGDLCGRRFGWFEEGLQADIIALETDPRTDKGALRKVDFVMKDAKIWKQNGNAVDMI